MDSYNEVLVYATILAGLIPLFVSAIKSAFAIQITSSL